MSDEVGDGVLGGVRVGELPVDVCGEYDVVIWSESDARGESACEGDDGLLAG